MTDSITYTNAAGQTVSAVPGQPGRVTTGRPQRVEIHNPTNDDPFALVPGAYVDQWDAPEHEWGDLPDDMEWDHHDEPEDYDDQDGDL